MPKIRSPRGRPETEGPAPTGAPVRRSSDLVLWYHANKQWLPLVGTVFGGAVLYLLSQIEKLRPTMGLLGGLVVIVGGVVWGMMRPEDAPVRVGRNKTAPIALVVGVLILVASLVPYLHVNFPGAPLFHGTLSPRRPSAEFRIPSARGLIEMVVHGQIRRGSGSAQGGYELRVEHGGKKRRVEGIFKRTYSSRKIRRGRVRIGSSSEFTYNVNQLRSLGTGPYKLTLTATDSSLESWVRVKVHESWYSDRQLYWALGVMVALGLAVDVLATRSRHRTKLAAAALVSIGFAIYYSSRFTPDAVMSTVIGGGLLAMVAGWVGGTVLGFLAKRLGNEPRVAKAGARDDDDE